MSHGDDALVDAGVAAGSEAPPNAAAGAESSQGAEGAPSLTADLSFGQQRLWVLSRLLPDKSAAYNTARAQRLSGSLDVGTLRRALNEVARRHETLRTTFSVIDGVPKQVIHQELVLDLPVEDLSVLPATERETAARQRAMREAVQVFDLERGPLIRARLLRLSADEHWLLIAMHHIITDRWSAAVLARETSELYAAFLRDEPSPLSELPVQYADYSVWQRQWADGETLQPHLAYWRQALAELSGLQLATDHPRPAIADYASGQVNFEINAMLTQALKELSRRERVTMFMTLLAAFQVLLYRYSGQDDIAVGVPIAGRSRPELEQLIGFFVNTLVLRGDLRGEPAFTAYLRGVRQTALDAYAHQDLPFEKLVDDLAPQRDLSRNPLFQVSFAFQNLPPVEWKLPGIDATRVDDLATEGAKFDLSFTLAETAGILQGRAEYATSLFDAGTIERMVGHWRTLLQGLISDPELPVSRLPLLSDAEQQALTVPRIAGAATKRPAGCIHDAVEAQAARRPDAVAVRFEGLQHTYAELNERANRLAHHLRSWGVGPEVLVALCVERSLDMVVAALAILKAGGAYVPLDPGYPAEHLAFMLDDTRAPVLVTHSALLLALAGYAGHVFCMDRDWGIVAAQPSTDPARVASWENLAYVIYTSGSTGKPKGVMVTHGNVDRLFTATHDWFGFDERDIWSCFHSFAFDFSVFEIWGALRYGATLVVVPYLVSRDPQRFRQLLLHERVTVLSQTPSAFKPLIAADAAAGDGDCLALRVVIFGGEALELQSLRPWIERHGDSHPRLINMYGITETTVHVTYRTVRLADLDSARGSMIGEPIPDLRIEILDRFMQRVPLGIPGEIYVGGPGVARGYLKRPELTAERFVADPFDTYAGAASRLYRSGDFARRTPDGDLEYLGRIDQQIKIRGFRIEPGEIKAALLQIPQIREAVFVLRGDTAETRHLIAYVVPVEGAQPTPADVWNALRQKVPDYMVPAAIVVLPVMPLTANGKIDYRALPGPGEIASQRSGAHLAPRDPLDNLLAVIWEELLGVRQIGIRHSFFDLGGHSLLAAQMIDTVEVRCGVKVPLTTLFINPTIEHLANAIRDQALRVQTPVMAINAEGTRPPMFFLHGDFTGGGFFSKPLALGLGPDQPFYVVHPHGLFTRDVPESIEAMADDLLINVRRARPHGPYVLSGHCAGALVALELARRLLQDGEKIEAVVIIDAVAPRRPQRVFEGVSIGAPPPTASRRRTLAQAPAAPPTNEGIIAKYRRIQGKYQPEPFVGKLIVLQPESRNDLRTALGWSAVSSDVETHVIPGDHHTAITRHIGDTAAVIRASLDKVARD